MPIHFERAMVGKLQHSIVTNGASSLSQGQAITFIGLAPPCCGPAKN